MIYKCEKVKGAMAEQGFTLETLAEKTGLSVMTISAVRNGKNVTIDTLKKVADGLGLNLSDLMNDTAPVGAVAEGVS